MKLKSKLSLSLFLVVSAIVAFSVPVANAQSVTLGIAGDASLVNHYPGPDGLIGNGDDVVSGALTTVQSSAPNVNGSLGYNAFKFTPLGQPDLSLPVGFDAITFVDGTITIDVDALKNGGGPIVSALNITSGTEPFPGHGAYTSTISAVNGGTYNPATKAFTLDVDITYVIFGSQTTEFGVVLTGTAIYTDDFGTATGNTYVDTVAVPLAQADGASSLVFFTATGTLPGLGFAIGTTLVAHDGGFNINAGLNDAWVSVDAAFQGLFFTVFEDLKLLFLSWFTFDSVQPDGGVTCVFGAPDQRWVTGAGTYSGNTVTISVELTSGGIFNGSDPLATQTPAYGTITIVFNNCNEAIMTYNFPSLGLSGEMTLTRVVDDNVALCEILAG